MLPSKMLLGIAFILLSSLAVLTIDSSVFGILGSDMLDPMTIKSLCFKLLLILTKFTLLTSLLSTSFSLLLALLMKMCLYGI